MNKNANLIHVFHSVINLVLKLM